MNRTRPPLTNEPLNREYIFILLARPRYYSLFIHGLLRRLLRYTDWIGGRRWASVTLSYELIRRVQSSGTLSPYQFHGASPINWTGSIPSIIICATTPCPDPFFEKIHYSKILSPRSMRRVYFVSHTSPHNHIITP